MNFTFDNDGDNIPCDFCLETFDQLKEYESHVTESHDLDPSLCILCKQRFSPGTRRKSFEDHIRYSCKLYYPSNWELQILPVPVADNMKPSIHNRQTQHWIYVRGQRFYLERDDALLLKTAAERKDLFYFLGRPIPELAPFERSPIVHYSSSQVISKTIISNLPIWTWEDVSSDEENFSSDSFSDEDDDEDGDDEDEEDDDSMYDSGEESPSSTDAIYGSSD